MFVAAYCSHTAAQQNASRHPSDASLCSELRVNLSTRPINHVIL